MWNIVAWDIEKGVLWENMFSSEACKFNLEKIYEHFPVTNEESML